MNSPLWRFCNSLEDYSVSSPMLLAFLQEAKQCMMCYTLLHSWCYYGITFLYLHLSAMKMYWTLFEPLWLSLCWTRSFKFTWWLRKHGFLLQSFPSTSKIPLPGTVLGATGLNLRKKQAYSYTPRYILKYPILAVTDLQDSGTNTGFEKY